MKMRIMCILRKEKHGVTVMQFLDPNFFTEFSSVAEGFCKWIREYNPENITSM